MDIIEVAKIDGVNIVERKMDTIILVRSILVQSVMRKQEHTNTGVQENKLYLKENKCFLS